LNGDGKPDLVVAGNGTVGLLLGNGDGTFQAAVPYGSGGSGASSVAVGDVNGDGKLDLVVANCGGSCYPGAVSVLLGNGDGTFQTAVSYGTVGYEADSVAVTDVNRDGKPDLLVTNYSCSNTCSNSTVSVLLNTSTGPTTTTVVSSLNPSIFVQAVTFSATVKTKGFKGVPTGTVIFHDGSTALGTGTLNGSGIATYATSNLSIGQHSITAAYGGDANDAGSTSATLIQTVNAMLATTTTTVVSGANPSMYGSSVTFTATVATSGSKTPTGTVTFSDGSAPLGSTTLNSSGVATYTTSGLIVGQHSLTAAYGGDTNNLASTSAALTQTVSPADFSLSASPSSTTVTAGNSGQFILTATPQGSFTTPISFSCSGLPNLAGCKFNPSGVTPNTSAVTTTLTITTAAHTAAHVAAMAPPTGHRTSPLYAIWLLLPALLLGTAGISAPNRRKLLTYCLAFLLVGGCLLQVACGGASTSGGGGGGGAGGTQAGTYTIIVTGAAGPTQHTASVTLTVQ
jgi:hypothetical protein